MSDICKSFVAQLADVSTLQSNDASKDLMQKLVAKTTLQLVTIRKKMRISMDDVDAVKAETNAMRADVDQHYMQLQSHLYEKNHYNKEIAACRSFK